jgi:hypothetical protein
MRRRDFIQGIAVSSAWPLAARAQQPATITVIGLLSSATASGWARHDRNRITEGIVAVAAFAALGAGVAQATIRAT